jgi:type III pantothenate kinase
MNHQLCLLLDIGNSRLKWNVWQSGAGQFSRQTQAVDYKTPSLENFFNNEWKSLGSSINAIFAANVAGDMLAKQVDAWCAKQWGIHPHFVSTGASFQSVKNGYRNYRELGIDRWLDVIAAHALYPDQPVIVVDCGTATTVDALTGNGQHRAGPIIPGRQMMLRALANNTADLKIVTGNSVAASVFAENTQAAILSGVNFATAGALSAIVGEMQQKLAGENNRYKVKVIVTGGAAEQLMPLTNIKDFIVEPDLVLIGLRVMADKTQ